MKKILLLITATFFYITGINAETKTAQTGERDWNTAGTWSPSGVPDADDQVVIPSGAIITVDATASIESINVNSGGYIFITNNMTIAGGTNSSVVAGSMTVSAVLTISANDLTVSGSVSIDPAKQVIFSSTSSDITNTGTITCNSDSNEFSSFIYRGTGYSGAGTFTYARYISAAGSAWDLIGSAVENETAGDIVSQGNLANQGSDFGIGTYDNTGAGNSGNGTWSTFSAGNAAGEGIMESGKGFQMATDNGATINFVGDLLDANATIAITEGDESGEASTEDGTRFNLLSNPYPSYVSANSNASTAAANGSDHLLNANNLNLLHANNQAIYVWGGSSYTTINASTAAGSATIAAGQGFMVGGNYGNSGNFTFSTAMVSEDGSDDGISGDAMDPDDRAELFIGLSQSDIDRHTEIYFLDNTTDGFEPAYDAGTLGIANNTIYSRLVEGDQGVDMSIQSLAYGEMWDKVIPIGVNAMAGEEMTISVTHTTTPADLKIYLEDAQEGTYTLINNEDFVLTPTSDLEGVGRFYIHMTADTLSDGEVNTSLLNAYKEVDTNYITIEGLSTQSTSTEVSLFNILGTKVMDTTLDNTSNTQMISTNGLSTGIYVIKLESGQNQLTKKLIIK